MVGSAKVFLSYSRKDKEIVERYWRLLTSAGMPTFYDVNSLEYGNDWSASIRKAIFGCRRFMLFWCAHAAESQHVRDEYQLALKRKKVIVPILLDKTPLPTEIAKFHGFDLAFENHELGHTPVAGDPKGLMPPKLANDIRRALGIPRVFGIVRILKLRC